MEGRINDVDIQRELARVLGWEEVGQDMWSKGAAIPSRMERVTWTRVITAERERIEKLAEIFSRVLIGDQLAEITSRASVIGTTVKARLELLESRVSRLERGESGLPSCTCDEPGDGPCPAHSRENQLQDRAIKAEGERDLYKANYQSTELSLSKQLEKEQGLDAKLHAARQATVQAEKRLHIEQERNELLEKALEKSSKESKELAEGLKAVLDSWLKGNGMIVPIGWQERKA